LLLSAYAPIFSLGTVETLLKIVPFLNGDGEREKAKEIEKSVFTFILIVSAFFLVALFAVPLVLVSDSLKQYIMITRLMLLAVSISMLSAFYYYRLEAYKKFSIVSAITSFRSVATLVLQISLGLLLGLTGVVLGYLLSEVLVCACSVFLSRRLPNSLGLRGNSSLYGMLIKTGMPITIIWWTFMIQTTVDRLVSMSMLGEVQTGFYGIGMSLTAAYLMLPDAINQVLYPSVNEKYGQTRRPQDLAPLVVDPARIMSLVLPFLSCAFVLLLPLIFNYIVPKYIPGLLAAQILIIGALFSGLTRGGANLLISIDKQRLLLALILGSTFLNLVGNILLVRLGLGIAGIAISTAVSSSLLALAVWLLVFKAIGFSMRKGLKLTFELFFPSIIFALLASANGVLNRKLPSTINVKSILSIVTLLLAYCGIIFAIPRYRSSIKESFGFLSGIVKARLRGEHKSLGSAAENGQGMFGGDGL
jgi:O-antigen/teichoic acid export membrane protein